MNNKKIAIIGKGTAGSISALYLKNRLPLEIDWYFDPSTPEQAVGEGSTLSFPNFLFHNTNFLYSDVEQILEGTYKNSIRKINYNGSGDYHHSFSLGNSGLHFNAKGFQQFTQNHLKNQINIIPKQITIGKSVTTFLLASLLTIRVSPNLWLFGAVLGAYY